MEKTVRPIVETYATVLRTRRLEARISQEELAHRAGISMRYVSLLEGCKYQPSLSVMDSVAQALGLTLSDMIAEAEALLAIRGSRRFTEG